MNAAPNSRQKVTPFLWFNDNAEEAANFYVSLFDNSRVTGITRHPHSNSVLLVEFTLAGVQYVAMNGGPHFVLNEAFSLTVRCETQEEVDMYWTSLSEGGSTSQCGWLKDRYGLSWQVVPAVLQRFMNDPHCAGKVMQALMGMTRPDIAELRKAAENAIADESNKAAASN